MSVKINTGRSALIQAESCLRLSWARHSGRLPWRWRASIEFGQVGLRPIVRVRLSATLGPALEQDPPTPQARAAPVGTAARHQLQRLFPDASVRTAQVLRPARGTGPGRHAFPPCSLWLDPAASCAEHVRRFQEAVSTQPNPDGHEQMGLGRWYDRNQVLQRGRLWVRFSQVLGRWPN